MSQLLAEIEDNISGIWGNDEYQLTLGMQPHNIFFFTDKKKDSNPYSEGEYFVEIDNDNYIILRLSWLDEPNKSWNCKIIELKSFESLTISHEGERIYLKNVPPDEYEGDIFNPADN